MSTINKTIGSGGDYSDIGNAWAYLIGLGSLADDYIFTLISNFNEVNGVNFNPVYFNGHTVSFLSPTRYTTTLPNSAGVRYKFGNGSSTGVLIVNGFSVYMDDKLRDDLPIMQRSGLGTVYYQNLFFNSQGTTGVLTAAISLGNPIGYGDNGTEYVQNCIFANHGIGISANILRGSTNRIENNSIYNCIAGIYRLQNDPADIANIKNTVCHGCNTDFSFGTSYNVLTNCADHDGTIAGSNAHTTKTNCVTGVANSDFVSVDPTAAAFLQISPKSKLQASGTTSLSSWNTSDILSRPRPDNLGKVNVGAYQNLNANVTLTIKQGKNIFSKTKTIFF